MVAAVIRKYRRSVGVGMARRNQVCLDANESRWRRKGQWMEIARGLIGEDEEQASKGSTKMGWKVWMERREQG